jgi:hypothetical protein
MNGNPLIGVWEPDAGTAKYVLQSCPPGYALLNTLDSNYAEVSSDRFNHDFQRCQQCDPKFEYILNYNGTCRECPRCVPPLESSVIVLMYYVCCYILLAIHIYLTLREMDLYSTMQHHR